MIVDDEKDVKPGDDAADDSSDQEDRENAGKKGKKEKEADTKPPKKDSESEDAESEDEEADESDTEDAKDASDDGEDSESEDEPADKNGADEKPHEKTVPYERFQEVNDRLRDAEAKIDRLSNEKKERTWDDLSIPELRQARKYYVEQKNDRMIEYLEDKIVEKKALEIVEARDGKRDFKERRAESWADVVSDYPELRNPESEHFKRTKALIASDPRYGKEPEGYAIAARLIAEQMFRDRNRIRKKATKTADRNVTDNLKRKGLESGSRPGTSTTTSSLEKLEAAAVASGSPYSAEWRRYMRAAAKAKKE